MDYGSLVIVAAIVGLLLWANGGPALAWLRTLWPSPRPDDGERDEDGDPLTDSELLTQLVEMRDDLLAANQPHAAAKVSEAIVLLLEIDL